MKKTMVGFTTSFPIYCVRTLGDHHVLVAGGGGQAKSGVPNRLELYLMEHVNNLCKLCKVGVLDTGVAAAMNMDVYTVSAKKGQFLIAIGQEG
ncbi:unnamed protein product [Soboliphyme baturini]|uniref:PFK domain-containing protein n=1 Tax=Soboliphyme baturini TaxID=241478 RepID=A0A183IM13_9BILA|nr:unnamed protein product [Soboliphyme baturini]